MSAQILSSKAACTVPQSMPTAASMSAPNWATRPLCRQRSISATPPRPSGNWRSSTPILPMFPSGSLTCRPLPAICRRKRPTGSVCNVPATRASQALLERRDELWSHLYVDEERMQNCRLIVPGIVYPGVEVSIGKAYMLVERQFENVCFPSESGRHHRRAQYGCGSPSPCRRPAALKRAMTRTAASATLSRTREAANSSCSGPAGPSVSATWPAVPNGVRMHCRFCWARGLVMPCATCLMPAGAP